MAKWLSHRRSVPAPRDAAGDAELADRMRRWAEQFEADWKGRNSGLSWDPADAYELDRLCESIVASNPSSEQLVHISAGLGSFVGEIVRRSVGGSWRIVKPPHDVALDLPSGDTVDPFVPAHLRLQPADAQEVGERLQDQTTSSAAAAITSSLQVWISTVLIRQWRLGKRIRPPATTPIDNVRQAAKDFVVMTAAGGDVFGWTDRDALALEQWCARLLEGRPSDSMLRELLPVLGAYLGELLVRLGGGRWEEDEAAQRFFVVMPKGNRASPLDQAEYRLRYGEKYNLRDYVFAILG